MVIVAAIKGSEQRTQIGTEAETLAEAFDESLHLVHVIEETEYTRLAENQSSKREADTTGTIEDNAAAAAADGIGEVVDVDYELVGLVGNPSEEIIRYADDVGARYIVVGGRARSPTGKALFGSVSQSILLKSDRPVVTITEQE